MEIFQTWVEEQFVQTSNLRGPLRISINTFQQLNWDVLMHPVHSPFLVPSDFHSYAALKNALRSH